ncbi:MAG: hypothetical protein IIZ17_05590 [Eubacteriaceae bacterium]|nr:hypothetical protein [Eubacteriaceae bacterium]
MAVTFDEFVDIVKNEIQSAVPEGHRDAVSVDQVTKPGESYTALSIRYPGRDTAVAVNLNRSYEQFRSGAPMEKILMDIVVASAKVPGKAVPRDLSWITDYEAVKERLFIKVSSPDSLKDIKGKAPYRLASDMVITYHILIGDTDDSLASAMITDQNIGAYDVTPGQLHEDAMENSQKIMPGRVEPLDDMVSGFMGSSVNIADASEPRLMVVTNRSGVDGAAAFFYPGVMDNAAFFFNSGYYVIPSSVNEVILVPESFSQSVINKLSDVVSEVNATMVMPQERLSNTAYHYDAKEGLFERIDVYQDRIAEKRLEEWKKDAPRQSETDSKHVQM